MTPIDFYFWPTPNGWKVAIMLEECGLPYRMIPVNIGKGDQFTPEFLKISPNNRMPAIVDYEGPEGAISVFESGAIMHYLAEKTGRFMPTDFNGRKETLEWLFWQTGNQGPMAGQYSHFKNYAPQEEREGYSRTRYTNEYYRCLGVLERQLEKRGDYILGDYSIVDMICWPWVLIAKAMDLTLEEYPLVSAWRHRLKERPAVRRAVNLGKEHRRQAPPDEDERKILFQQK